MIEFLKKRWYIIVIILAIIGFIFLRVKSNTTSGTNGKKQTTHKAKRQNLKETLSLSGSVDAEERAILRFQSSGKMVWVGVKQGDYVKKYQAVASLDQREIQKNLEKALRDYSKERWDFEEDRQVTYRSVFTDTAKRILEKNQFDLDKAVLDVEIKQFAIEVSTLVSPIEGIVTRIGSPYAGVNITPSQAEFEIINPKTIYFSGTADQNDVVRLKQDEKGEIVLDAYPDITLKGKIYMISFVPKTDETGTLYQVKLALTQRNDDYKYRFGMTGDASFTIREIKNVLAVPTKFVKTEKKPDGTLIREYVLKKINGNQEKTTVEIGEDVDEYTIITSGLKEGDMVYD